MITKDPVEIALNRLHVALRRAADQYHHAAERADHPDVSTLLRNLAAERQQMAERLESHIRAIGLPRLPHPEREAIEKLTITVKIALAGDRRETLLRDQEILEQEIAQASAAALQEQLSEPARRFVHSVAEQVIEAQQRFSQMKSGSGG